MLKIVCLALFIAAVSAGIPYKDCGMFYLASRLNILLQWSILLQLGHAEVTNVAISGCTTSPCTLHKGKEVTIDIDFTASE